MKREEKEEEEEGGGERKEKEDDAEGNRREDIGSYQISAVHIKDMSEIMEPTALSLEDISRAFRRAERARAEEEEAGKREGG